MPRGFSPSLLSNLPAELLESIFERLDARSLASLPLASPQSFAALSRRMAMQRLIRICGDNVGLASRWRCVVGPQP